MAAAHGSHVAAVHMKKKYLFAECKNNTRQTSELAEC